MAEKPTSELTPVMTVTIATDGAGETNVSTEFHANMPVLRSLTLMGQAAAGMIATLVQIGTAKGMTQDECIERFFAPHLDKANLESISGTT